MEQWNGLGTFTQGEATGGAHEGGEGGGAGVGGGGGDVGGGGPVQQSPSLSLTLHQTALHLLLIFILLQAFISLHLHSIESRNEMIQFNFVANIF